MRKIFKFFGITLLFSAAFHHDLFSQGSTNTNPKMGFVNVNIPKTPESAGFEKYGNTQVSEFTGTTNIAVPIYTLKSRFLESPITLSYQSIPVRVNQEASWVGLGFDLIAGGRITVETRGAVDFCQTSYFLAGQATLATGMSQIFTRLGNSGENAVYTPATFCEPNSSCPDPNYYNGQAISDMTQFGVGEPDIFRANFLGHSLTFYVDKISNTIKFIGENSFFSILYTLDSYHNITNWTIKDNEGITYLFQQAEITNNTLTSPIVPGTSTSAWLLTKISHPTGDYIQYSYNNFGPVVPAFTINSTIDFKLNTLDLTVQNDLNQNINIQNPYYLTRMETSSVAVDFILSARTDLYGIGSRKISQITVTDKLTNIVKKTASFSYSYFQASVDQNSRNYLNSLFFSLPNTMSQSAYLATSNSRLKLDEVSIGGNGISQPSFKFNYNGIVVDKYSLSQDHWGYYNGVNNSSSGQKFTHLIPYTFMGNQVVFNQNFLNALGSVTLGYNRECDAGLMQAMMLTEIVYPTGGKSVFTYEPHQSTMSPTIPITGGGLRVKTIKNYIDGNLAGTTEYSYSGGKYMGMIKYITSENVLGACEEQPGSPSGHLRLSTSGAVNANDISIGYNQISITRKDNSGQPNGYVNKTFNITSPSSNYSNNGAGIDIAPPYLSPNESVPSYISPWIPQNYATWLDMSNKLFPPTPSSNLEGKLMAEKYYDKNNNLLKSVDYLYHLANYSNNFYCVKAIQNRESGFDYPSSCGSPSSGNGTGGLRPVNLFVSPAKCFNAQLDSKVESTYSSGSILTTTANYTFDSNNQLKTEQTINSDGSNKTITYLHPYDDLRTYYFLMSAHMYSTIISSTETHNGNIIKIIKKNIFQPSSGVYVPQSIEMQIANNPIETRELYNVYDSYGNLLEKQKPNGVKEVYLWGYDKYFPVASVIGSDYTTVSSLVDISILNAPVGDAALKLELNKIRTGVANAIVTTYTYDNIYGVTSQTDPRGRTSYYSYDGMGRLSVILDNEGNVLKKICYNYAGQPENCVITTSLNSWNKTTTPWNITITNSAGTFNSTYSFYPNAAASLLATLPMDIYTFVLTPMYTGSVTSPVDVILNGTTYSGTSFNIPNVNIIAAAALTLQNQVASGPCSFTMNPGYSTPTNNISSNGSTASFYIVFYSSSVMTQGNSYLVATINGACRPSATRTITTTSGGRTWTITIYPSGQMYWQMAYGSAQLNPNSTVGTNTLTYNL